MPHVQVDKEVTNAINHLFSVQLGLADVFLRGSPLCIKYLIKTSTCTAVMEAKLELPLQRHIQRTLGLLFGGFLRLVR